MSTYYYLACDKCRVVTPFWGIWAGGGNHLKTVYEDRNDMTMFLITHYSHGIKVANEHSDAFYDYEHIPDED